MLRHRSEEALRRKARRGELFMTVAVGYERVGRDAIGMDPDRRVQEAIALVFRKFAEFGSIRQVHLWLRHEGIELPAVLYEQSQRRMVWKLPVYNAVHHVLTNPIYAGAYQPVAKVGARRGSESTAAIECRTLNGHGDGQETGVATGVADVGEHGRPSDEQRPSFLRAAEPDPGGVWV